MKLEHLECDRCGDWLRELSNSEAQQVARDPYKYIVYCRLCKKDIEEELGLGN